MYCLDVSFGLSPVFTGNAEQSAVEKYEKAFLSNRVHAANNKSSRRMDWII